MKDFFGFGKLVPVAPGNQGTPQPQEAPVEMSGKPVTPLIQGKVVRDGDTGVLIQGLPAPTDDSRTLNNAASSRSPTEHVPGIMGSLHSFASMVPVFASLAPTVRPAVRSKHQ